MPDALAPSNADRSPICRYIAGYRFARRRRSQHEATVVCMLPPRPLKPRCPENPDQGRDVPKAGEPALALKLANTGVEVDQRSLNSRRTAARLGSRSFRRIEEMCVRMVTWET